MRIAVNRSVWGDLLHGRGDWYSNKKTEGTHMCLGKVGAERNTPASLSSSPPISFQGTQLGTRGQERLGSAVQSGPPRGLGVDLGRAQGTDGKRPACAGEG